MAPIVSTIEIARPPAEVFSYVTDPTRFAEWQANVVSGGIEGEGLPRVGSRCSTTRRIGGSERPATSEITELNPPMSWAVRGIDGPVRANVRVSVEPLNETTRSRVKIELDFEGHGIGTLLVPLVIRRQAQKQLPGNLQNLKEQLERRQ
jgi:uncharacterized protein YndB with AHSA1/START domain